jgi:hypothetical protein
MSTELDISNPNAPTAANAKVDLTKLKAVNQPKTLQLAVKPLQKTFEGNMDYLKMLWQNAEAARMHTYWHIGRIVSGMKEAGSYGDNVVEKSCESLGIQSSLLYEIIKFYNMFSDEVEANAINNNPNCAWAKVKQVMRVKEPLERSKLLDRVKKDPKITTRSLEQNVNAMSVNVIKDMEAKKKQKQKRYKPKPYFAGIVSKLERNAKAITQMNSDLAGVLGDLEGVLQNMDKDGIPDDVWYEYLKQFQEASMKAEETMALAQNFQDKQLHFLVNRFNKYYEERTEKQ